MKRLLAGQTLWTISNGKLIANLVRTSKYNSHGGITVSTDKGELTLNKFGYLETESKSNPNYSFSEPFTFTWAKFFTTRRKAQRYLKAGKYSVTFLDKEHYRYCATAEKRGYRLKLIPFRKSDFQAHTMRLFDKMMSTPPEPSAVPEPVLSIRYRHGILSRSVER